MGSSILNLVAKVGADHSWILRPPDRSSLNFLGSQFSCNDASRVLSKGLYCNLQCIVTRGKLTIQAGSSCQRSCEQNSRLQRTVPVGVYRLELSYFFLLEFPIVFLASLQAPVAPERHQVCTIKSYSALQALQALHEFPVERARRYSESLIMPEIMPDNPIQPEHEASSSARASVEKTLLKNLQECLRALLQLDPSLAQRDVGFGDTLRVAETSMTIPHSALSQYCHLLDVPIMLVYELLFYLMGMVDSYPQLLMEVSPTYQRTFLHVAVIANSEVQVRKLLDTMLADKDIVSSNSRKDHMSKNLQYLSTVESLSGFTAYQMACIVGNDRIVRMIESCQETFISTSGNIPTSLAANHVIGRKDHSAKISQPLIEEQRKVHIRRIGKVLKSCLQPLGFSIVPLKIMSLGDEFRLHTSLIAGDKHTLTCWIQYGMSNDIAQLLRNIVSKLAEKNLLSTFLELRDNAGRHILHYLADVPEHFAGDSPRGAACDLIFTTLMHELDRHVPELDMNVTDSVGRTPLHLAAGQGFAKRVELFANDIKTDLNATFKMSSCGIDREGNIDHDVEEISPLSLAATHNHFEVVKRLLKAPSSRKSQPLHVNLRIVKEIRLIKGDFKASVGVQWTPLQLAAFKGNVETLEVLLADDRVRDSERMVLSEKPRDEQISIPSINTAPALHLAALGGKPYAIKALLRSDKIDPFVLDVDGNTALYPALQHSQFHDVYGPWEFTNVPDCFPSFTNKLKKSKNSGGIIGCIDLLLQAGLDMNQTNKYGLTPQIGPETPDGVQQWWYDKLAREVQVTKNNVSAATNAISVTAALVAATSFVGPLQPPLGLSTNTDAENTWLLGYSQVNHIAVDVFLFFDSLSFYLAIASIMLALIPSLPIQREGIFLAVKRAQRYLQGAVVLLFASIIFLICTFGAASVVIIPEGRWKYKAIIVSTTIFGGFICLVVLILFLKRLWRLIKPKGQPS